MSSTKRDGVDKTKGKSDVGQRIWVVEQMRITGRWRFVDYEETREDARSEIVCYRTLYPLEKFRVRAYQRVESSK